MKFQSKQKVYVLVLAILLTLWGQNTVLAQTHFLEGLENGKKIRVSAKTIAVQFESRKQAEAAAKQNGMAYIHLDQVSAFKRYANGFFRLEKSRYSKITLKEFDQLISTLRKTTGALHVGYSYRASVTATPNDPSYGDLWGMEQIGAPAAWDIQTDCSNLVVMVNDSGVNYTHPDLKDNMWINPGETAGNNQDDDGNGVVDDIHGADYHSDDGDPNDEYEHGSHCAGTIAAVGNNGVGVAGVCWKAKIMACRCLGPDGNGEDANCGRCVEYGLKMRKEHGVRLVVISNSWTADGDNAVVKAAFEALDDANIVSTIAAGNDMNDNESSPVWPGSYNLPLMITVMATESGDGIADYSNWGKNSVHLGAPGSSVYSTTLGQYYGWMDGTSMACPHVAGAVTLIAAKNNSTNGKAIKQVLLDNVDPVSGYEDKVTTGGRLNLHQALENSDIEPDTDTGDDDDDDTGDDDDDTGDDDDDTGDDDDDSSDDDDDNSSDDDDSDDDDDDVSPDDQSDDDDDDDDNDNNNDNNNENSATDQGGCGCVEAGASPASWSFLRLLR